MLFLWNYLRFDSSMQIVLSFQPFPQLGCHCYRQLRLIRKIELKATAIASVYYWLEIFLSFSYFLSFCTFQLTRSVVHDHCERINCENSIWFLALVWIHISFIYASPSDDHRHKMTWMNLLFHSRLFFLLRRCRVCVSFDVVGKEIWINWVKFCFEFHHTKKFLWRDRWMNVFMHQRWTHFMCFGLMFLIVSLIFHFAQLVHSSKRRWCCSYIEFIAMRCRSSLSSLFVSNFKIFSNIFTHLINVCSRRYFLAVAFSFTCEFLMIHKSPISCVYSFRFWLSLVLNSIVVPFLFVYTHHMELAIFF